MVSGPPIKNFLAPPLVAGQLMNPLNSFCNCSRTEADGKVEGQAVSDSGTLTQTRYETGLCGHINMLKVSRSHRRRLRCVWANRLVCRCCCGRMWGDECSLGAQRGEICEEWQVTLVCMWVRVRVMKRYRKWERGAWLIAPRRQCFVTRSLQQCIACKLMHTRTELFKYSSRS